MGDIIVNYKIIVDSCCDLTSKYKEDEHFVIVPLTLEVGSQSIIDDENFNQQDFLDTVQETSQCPKSACPSPNAYKEACECDAERIYIVTLSQHLSGSYNSAMLGKSLYIEEHGENKHIHVFSSDSASCGESLIAFKIQELEQQGLDFDEICQKVQGFLENMTTYFVLESLDFLKKNGRLTGLAAMLATALNIKPLMAGNKGVIVKLDQARGMTKGVKKLIDYVADNVKEPASRVLAIAHCNCPARANYIKEEISKRIHFKDVYITDTAGVSSLYAGNGGVIVTF
jgi:DegV family protein with EDD domain